MTPAAFKRSIRDLQVWCSSCMVAFSGSDPIGVLIGAKRPSGTLVHTIAGATAEAGGAARSVIPAGNGTGYLNEVSPLTQREVEVPPKLA